MVDCVVSGVPVGIGDPAFGRLGARLAEAMMSINATKGFEYGMGFRGVELEQVKCFDRFVAGPDGEISTLTNHSGGIQGGISNGQDITFRVAFKPVATRMQDVRTVDRDGNEIVIKAKGDAMIPVWCLAQCR